MTCMVLHAGGHEDRNADCVTRLGRLSPTNGANSGGSLGMCGPKKPCRLRCHASCGATNVILHVLYVLRSP